MDKPLYNEAAKMFDIIDSYLCKVHNKGWEWDEAVNIYKNIGMMKNLIQIMKIQIYKFTKIKYGRSNNFI